MGTNFFQPRQKSNGGNLNMEAKAIGAPGYMARAAGGAAAKDLGAAMAYRKNNYGGPSKTAAKAAPGPKKV